MQSTFIKIKFTPLMRQLHKDNTKCSLEIVPDISSIQNLDKIEWTEGKLLEYNVPVTYKIILKKGTRKNTTKKQDKIYYSCIDLRFLCTNFTLACGDVNKVLSENYMLSKVAADFNSSYKISKHSPNEKLPKDVCIDGYRMPINIANELNKSKYLMMEDDVGNEKKTAENIEVLSCRKCTEVLVEENKLLKETYTDYTVPKETVTNLSDISKDNEEKIHKLTVTSICNLNTLDNPTWTKDYDNMLKNNPNIYLEYEQNNLIDYKINESFPIYRTFYTEIDDFFQANTPRKRILPEMRVATFMLTVESEIFPLKILLDEIYSKCASLGLLWQLNAMQESEVKSSPKYTNKVKFFNNMETKPKCNRVVYSVVFEE